MRKRGQFFIMAAVVLAILMFSMAFTANYVRANDPDKAFFDYADVIEREADSVLDYQVYNNVADMNSFIEILETDFRDRQVGSNFLIIYGNRSGIRVKNLGTEGIYVGSDDSVVKGAIAKVESKIRVGGFSGLAVQSFNRDSTESIIENPGDNINITFNDYAYDFPLSDTNQVIFIVQKDVDDETYVEVR